MENCFASLSKTWIFFTSDFSDNFIFFYVEDFLTSCDIEKNSMFIIFSHRKLKLDRLLPNSFSTS